jgi:trehalose-6-phosphatase
LQQKGWLHKNVSAFSCKASCICIGDDDQDEEALAVIHARDGVAIKVVQPSQLSNSMKVHIMFMSPETTIRWLEDLAK